MNFQDLLSKMKQLDEEVVAPADAPAEIPSAAVEECGMDMMPPIRPMPAPKQSDSLTMNVSMNGSGAGGIRDLMNILKDIQGDAPTEPHTDHDHGEPLFGDEIEKESTGGFDSATTSPNEVTLDIDNVVNTGAPINGGDHRPRQAGLPIGNPHVHEGLVSRLADHYNDVKNR